MATIKILQMLVELYLCNADKIHEINSFRINAVTLQVLKLSISIHENSKNTSCLQIKENVHIQFGRMFTHIHFGIMFTCTSLYSNGCFPTNALEIFLNLHFCLASFCHDNLRLDFEH